MKAFECKQCGTCCYGEGGIRLDEGEAGAIAGFLGIPLERFFSDYCETRNGRVYIRCGDDGFCIFYDRERQCLIHPVNPRVCSLWPFYPAILKEEENWRLAQDACPGINPDCPFEEFVNQAKGALK